MIANTRNKMTFFPESFKRAAIDFPNALSIFIDDQILERQVQRSEIDYKGFTTIPPSYVGHFHLSYPKCSIEGLQAVCLGFQILPDLGQNMYLC